MVQQENMECGLLLLRCSPEWSRHLSMHNIFHNIVVKLNYYL